jgi:hypothetical protein
VGGRGARFGFGAAGTASAGERSVSVRFFFIP